MFQQIEGILHTERLVAPRTGGADSSLTLSRYLLNMALSEAFYLCNSPLSRRYARPTRRRLQSTFRKSQMLWLSSRWTSR